MGGPPPALVTREVRIHDTLSGELRPLQPRDAPRVGIYACGPTVYGRIHIGNARPFVVFALLKRFLEHEGYEVTLVENITDLNDKIYDAAREAGVPSEQLAREMTAAYVADTDRDRHRTGAHNGADGGQRPDETSAHLHRLEDEHCPSFGPLGCRSGRRKRRKRR